MRISGRGPKERLWLELSISKAESVRSCSLDFISDEAMIKIRRPGHLEKELQNPP